VRLVLSGAARRSARDQLREQRLDDIIALADRFIYDLGRLVAGHRVHLESYVRPDVSRAMQESLRPFLASGDVLRPDFGLHAELRVEGDLLTPGAAVDVLIDFEDRSVRESSSGRRLATARRPVRISMVVSLEPARISRVTLTLR
jgi:hypothetical protein